MRWDVWSVNEMNNRLRHQCVFATNEDQINMKPNGLGKRGLEKANALEYVLIAIT